MRNGVISHSAFSDVGSSALRALLQRAIRLVDVFGLDWRGIDLPTFQARPLRKSGVRKPRSQIFVHLPDEPCVDGERFIKPVRLVRAQEHAVKLATAIEINDGAIRQVSRCVWRSSRSNIRKSEIVCSKVRSMMFSICWATACTVRARASFWEAGEISC